MAPPRLRAAAWARAGGQRRVLRRPLPPTGRPRRRAATTAASTDSATSSGVWAPICSAIGMPAGATMAATAAASWPAVTSASFSTWALRALATSQTVWACSARAARRPCTSRRPWVATTTRLPGAMTWASAAGSSLASTWPASAKRAASAPWATTVTCRPTRGARPASATATGESPITTSRLRGGTGSTNSSSVPPEWQAMPNSSTSSSS